MGKRNNPLAHQANHFSALALIAVLLLSSCNWTLPYRCTDPLGCLEVPPGSPLIMGEILATTGDWSSIGIDAQRGIELAISDTPKLLGHTIIVERQRTDCTEISALGAAEQLSILPDLLIIVGPTCPDELRSAGPVIAGTGLAMISPSIPGTNDYSGLLQTIYPSGLLAIPANFIAEKLNGHRIVGIEGDPMDGGGQTGGFVISTWDLSADTLTRAAKLHFADIQSVLAFIGGDRPDAILLSTSPVTAGQLVGQIRAAPGLENIPIIGNSSVYSIDFIQSAGPASLGVYLTGPDLAALDPAYSTFEISYKTAFDQYPLTTYPAFAYDTAGMIFDAIETIAFQGRDGSLEIPRKAFRAQLLKTRGLPGITGTIECDSSGLCASPSVTQAIYQITDPNPSTWHPGINPKRVYP